MFYWFFSIFGVILLIFSLLLDFEFFFLFFNLFILHLYNGLKSLILDYIHIKKLNDFFIFLIKIFLINFLIILLEFLL